VSCRHHLKRAPKFFQPQCFTICTSRIIEAFVVGIPHSKSSVTKICHKIFPKQPDFMALPGQVLIEQDITHASFFYVSFVHAHHFRKIEPDYFFLGFLSSSRINVHMLTHSKFTGRYLPSAPGFMTALCFAPHTRHSIRPADSRTSFITFFVMLPISIRFGDKYRE